MFDIYQYQLWWSRTQFWNVYQNILICALWIDFSAGFQVSFLSATHRTNQDIFMKWLPIDIKFHTKFLKNKQCIYQTSNSNNWMSILVNFTAFSFCNSTILSSVVKKTSTVLNSLVHLPRNVQPDNLCCKLWKKLKLSNKKELSWSPLQKSLK